MPTLKKVLESIPRTEKKTAGPIWEGPEVDGVTFSLLTKFLTCRERFRLYVIEGLRPADSFNEKMEFGQMWHTCEEAIAAGKDWSGSCAGGPLGDYAKGLCKRYPLSQERIQYWYDVTKLMFPLYVDYWSKHADVTGRTPVEQEKVFDVEYPLPSGREVRLRGKRDSVDRVGKGKNVGVYLKENKTKQRIEEQKIARHLTFDLQTMMYLTALYAEWDGKIPIKGVLYNVVRRPSQYQGKKETREGFLDRLRGLVELSPGEFFMRWKVEMTAGDVQRFRRECLDPILGQLCQWWDWVKDDPDPFGAGSGGAVNTGIHWRHPFGSVNGIEEYGGSDLDAYLESGSEVGLQRVTELFGELK